MLNSQEHSKLAEVSDKISEFYNFCEANNLDGIIVQLVQDLYSSLKLILNFIPMMNDELFFPDMLTTFHDMM